MQGRSGGGTDWNDTETADTTETTEGMFRSWVKL